MQVNAVVLAGGDAGKVVPGKKGLKSLLELGSKPLISYVVESLQQAEAVNKIIIVCPLGTKASFLTFGEEVLEISGTLVGKIASAFKLTNTDYVLVVSSDTPFITGEIVDNFIEKCTGGADFYYPIVPKELTEAKFPQTKRTYLRLTEGTFTGGNLQLINKATFLRELNMAEKVFSLRKSPIGLLGLLGWRFVVKFFFGRLSIKDIEAKAGAVLAAKVKAVVCNEPEIGVDIDKPEDWQLACEYFQQSAITTTATSTS